MKYIFILFVCMFTISRISCTGVHHEQVGNSRMEAKLDLLLAYVQKHTQLQARQTGLQLLNIAVNATAVIGIFFLLSHSHLINRQIARGLK